MNERILNNYIQAKFVPHKKINKDFTVLDLFPTVNLGQFNCTWAILIQCM